MELADLKENAVVLTGFQFVEKEPLGFFEFDDPNDREKIFKNKTQGFTAKGTIRVDNNGFLAKRDPSTGKLHAKTDLCVVNRAKSRPVLIFQDVTLCKKYHENVFIIPIQSIEKPTADPANPTKYKEEMEYYNKIIARSEEIYDLYYIPKKENGKIHERVLKLSDARFVHISNLFGRINENEVSKEEVEEIGIRLAKMWNINKLEKCDECMKEMKAKEQGSECQVEVQVSQELECTLEVVAKKQEELG